MAVLNREEFKKFLQDNFDQNDDHTAEIVENLSDTFSAIEDVDRYKKEADTWRKKYIARFRDGVGEERKPTSDVPEPNGPEEAERPKSQQEIIDSLFTVVGNQY